MPTNQWAVITGASAGIGASIFRRLVLKEPNLNCLGVARRLPQLEKVKTSVDEAHRDRAHILSADVSTPEGIAQIVSALPKDASVKYLIHNAGLLGPIGPLLDIDRRTWDKVIATNLDAPLFLTQALLPHLKRCSDGKEGGTKARVLHVSSGAAHSSYVGWTPYCVSKAGLNMMYRCLSAELYQQNVLVGSARPGVVDTYMQVEIRDYNGREEDFPMKSKFNTLHETGKLEDPDNVAKYFSAQK